MTPFRGSATHLYESEKAETRGKTHKIHVYEYTSERSRLRLATYFSALERVTELR